MDNFSIDITAEGQESLAKAIRIAFEHNAPGGKATHYSVRKLGYETTYYLHDAKNKEDSNVYGKENFRAGHSKSLRDNPKGQLTLILHWHGDDKESKELPYPLRVDEAINFVSGWLENAGNPGKEPDHDGDNGAGWRVFTEYWGNVGDASYSILAIQAAWAMYGK